MITLDTAKNLLDLHSEREESLWIIDGGCHVGKFSSRAIEVFPEAQVLAFEPDPDSWRTARENLQASSEVEVFNAALGAENGKAEFFRGPYSATNSLLARPDADSRPYYPAQAVLEGGTEVEVATLDHACALRGIAAPEIVKLDLQGGELAALQGARALLGSGRVKVIITEVVFIQKYMQQPLLWEIWRFLEGYGYSLFSLEDVKVGLYHEELRGLRHRQWNQCDAIFISRATRAALDG